MSVDVAYADHFVCEIGIAVSVEQLAEVRWQARAVRAEQRPHVLLELLRLRFPDHVLDRHDEWRFGDDAGVAVHARGQLLERAAAVLPLGLGDRFLEPPPLARLGL